MGSKPTANPGCPTLPALFAVRVGSTYSRDGLTRGAGGSKHNRPSLT